MRVFVSGLKAVLDSHEFAQLVSLVVRAGLLVFDFCATTASAQTSQSPPNSVLAHRVGRGTAFGRGSSR